MGFEFSIDRQTGSIDVGSIQLRPLQEKSDVDPRIDSMLKGSRDHGNGYEWLYFEGVTFGGQTAFLGLCFHFGQLEEASWSVRLPEAPLEGGWPTRQAADEEIAFVRRTLAEGGFNLTDGSAKLHWGEIWSGFDAKGGLASHGLRYLPLRENGT